MENKENQKIGFKPLTAFYENQNKENLKNFAKEVYNIGIQNIIDEYILIIQKKSKLSSMKRNIILHIIQTQFEKKVI